MPFQGVNKEWLKEHDAAIARAATLAERDRLIDEAITACEWDGPFTQEDVWRVLESLRAKLEEP
jgi:hypothetical protein